MFPILQGEKFKIILCYIKQRTQVWYLFAVALTFLSSSNRIKCRNEVHRTISKIFTTCNRGLVYAQRVGILKYRVSLTIGIGKRKTLTRCNLWQCNTTMKTLLHILLRLHWFSLCKYEKKHLRALLQKMLFITNKQKDNGCTYISLLHTKLYATYAFVLCASYTLLWYIFLKKKKRLNVSARQ